MDRGELPGPSEEAKKRAEAAKAYIDNLLNNQTKTRTDKKERCVHGSANEL